MYSILIILYYSNLSHVKIDLAMWQETKHGLFKQFNFKDFKEAFAFMTKAAAIAERFNHHFRWENDYNFVQIWLITHDSNNSITDIDRAVAEEIDKIKPVNENKEVIVDNSNTISYYKLKLYADGGSRGNPGPSASGFVIFDEHDNIIHDEGVYLGITTNNQAEYTALKLALAKCHELGAQEVSVFMDSLLVVNQMKGIFKVRNKDLWPIHDNIATLAKEFKHISYQHVPRELNKLADAAVNRALDDKLDQNS